MSEANIALFDMDDTLVDYTTSMIESHDLIRNPHDRKIPDRTLPWINNRINLIQMQVGWWRNLKPLQLGFDLYNAAITVGFKVHILTKGPSTKPHVWTEKVEWVREHLGDDPVTITEDKGLVYGKLLVDDYPGYVERWLKWRPRGMVIMVAHEHNKDFSHPNVIRFDGTNMIEIQKVLTHAYRREPGKEK